MEENKPGKLCKFCKRDVNDVAPLYSTKENEDGTQDFICADCGTTPPPSQERRTPELAPPHPNDQYVRMIQQKVANNVELFTTGFTPLIMERIRQVTEYGYDAPEDMHKTMAEFVIYMEKYLNEAKRRLASHNPQDVANARHSLVKVATLAVEYLATHPLPNV